MNIIMLVLSISIAVIAFTVLVDASTRFLAEKRAEKPSRNHYVVEVGTVPLKHGSHRRIRI